MKQTGIIMSGDHPLKVLDGRKTMTRRTWGLEKINDMPYLWEKPFYSEEMGAWGFWQKNTGDVIYLKCPYGGVGDYLWMKETWSSVWGGKAIYRADGEAISKDTGKAMMIWRPSIHMFRKDSRADLKIITLGAERVQEIKDADLIAEGIPPASSYPFRIENFIRLWDFLNAKRGLDWDFNPWVWPIGYKLMK